MLLRSSGELATATPALRLLEGHGSWRAALVVVSTEQYYLRLVVARLDLNSIRTKEFAGKRKNNQPDWRRPWVLISFSF